MSTLISEYAQEVLLLSHLDLCYNNLQRILTDPKLYYITLPSVFFGASPIGKRTVYLGDLLQLWRSGSPWFYQTDSVIHLTEGWSRGAKKQRPTPQGVYVLQCTGSALSGANSSLVWDIEEKTLLKIMLPSMFSLLTALQHVVLNRPMSVSIEKGESVLGSIAELIHYLENE